MSGWCSLWLSLSTENDFYPHNVEQLGPSEYLARILPKWKISVKKSLHMKKNGSPILLIVTSSAIRAVELNRLVCHFRYCHCHCTALTAMYLAFKLTEIW